MEVKFDPKRPYGIVQGDDIQASYYQDGKYFDADGDEVDISDHLNKYQAVEEEQSTVTVVDTVPPLPTVEELTAMERDLLVGMLYQRTTQTTESSRTSKKQIIEMLVEHDKEMNPDHYKEPEGDSGNSDNEGDAE